jgi:hypothetical protein
MEGQNGMLAGETDGNALHELAGDVVVLGVLPKRDAEAVGFGFE